MGLKDSYDILNKLGDGAFSNVFLAVHRITKVNVAIKIIQKNNDANHHNIKYSDFIREVQILRSLNHPNIVKFFEYFEDDSNFYIVQELCENGNAAQYIMEYGPSESPEIKRIFLQLINALQYLHEVASVLHCDIKAENILLDNNNNVKLADFGFSYDQKNNDEINQEFSKKIKGSPAYISPEILLGDNNSIKSDIWSSGIFLYYLLTGSLPFDDDEIDGLIHCIVQMKPTFPSYLSFEAIDLINKILKKDPKKRYSIKQIKNHKWLIDISNPLDEIYKSMNYDEDVIDFGIVQQMMKLDSEYFISSDSIIDDIDNDKMNDVTTSYQILLKKKENEALNNLLKILKKRTPHQRSSDIGESPLYHYRPRSRSHGNRQTQIRNGNRQKKILINSKGNIPRAMTSIENLK